MTRYEGSVTSSRHVFLPAVLLAVSCAQTHPASTLSVRLDDAKGLEPGRPVLVRGVRAGTVTATKLLPDAVLVEFTLDPSQRVTEAACATIGTLGLLGDAHLRVELGADGAPRTSGGPLRACPSAPGVDQATEKLVGIMADMSRASGSLERYMDAVEKGKRSLVEWKPAGSAAPPSPPPPSSAASSPGPGF